MNKELNLALATGNHNIINNPNICIGRMGTSFACVCPDCSEKRHKEFTELMKQYV